MVSASELLEYFKNQNFLETYEFVNKYKFELPKEVFSKLISIFKILIELNQKLGENHQGFKYQEIRTQYIQNLKNLMNLVEANKVEINEFHKKIHSLTLNCSKIGRPIRSPHKPIILLDSNFIKNVVEKAKSEQKSLLDLNFDFGVIIIFDRIFEEIRRGRIWKPNDPLVPESIRNYFISLSERQSIDYNDSLNKRYENLVVNIWSLYCKKSEFTKIDDFKRSGEMSILIFCLSNSQMPIEIFSNDNDILQTVLGFRDFFSSNDLSDKQLRESLLSLAIPETNLLMKNVKVISFDKKKFRESA